MPPTKRCLNPSCRQLHSNAGPRCETCTKAHQAARDRARQPERTARYNTAWRKHSAAAIKAHIETHGYVCPGWEIPAHPTHDLVCDHDVGPLCRSCNSRKAARHDKGIR